MSEHTLKAFWGASSCLDAHTPTSFSIFEASNRDPVTINAFFRCRGIHLERAKRKKECKERQRVRDITAVPCEDTLPGKLSSVMTKFGYCENLNWGNCKCEEAGGEEAVGAMSRQIQSFHFGFKEPHMFIYVLQGSLGTAEVTIG